MKEPVMRLSHGNLIMSLDQITKEDVDKVGGKATNLGEMRRAGFSVPEAFVVTTDAYTAFSESSSDTKNIALLLEDLDVDDRKQLEWRSAQVRETIGSAPIPKSIAAEIFSSYRDLLEAGGELDTVAVRSSATADGVKDSRFAGLHPSFLNVGSEEELLSSIKNCWTSAFTSMALFCRAKQGLPLAAPLTAVVVQRQIASEKSGRGFSIHPATGDRDKIVVESSWGQGEEIVTGRVTPDTFVFDKTTGKVLEERLAEKKMMRIPRLDRAGLEEFNVPRAMRNVSSLEYKELQQLWLLAKRLEAHSSSPQDFQWAIESGQVLLLQTRAVRVPAAGPTQQVPLQTSP